MRFTEADEEIRALAKCFEKGLDSSVEYLAFHLAQLDRYVETHLQP